MAGTTLLHPLEIEPSSITLKTIESKPEKHDKIGDPSIGILGENCNFHVQYGQSTEEYTFKKIEISTTNWDPKTIEIWNSESTEAKTIAISAKTVKKTEQPQGYRSVYRTNKKLDFNDYKLLNCYHVINYDKVDKKSFMLTLKALASRLSEIHCSKMVKRPVAETDSSIQNIGIDLKRWRISLDTILEQNWYEFHTQLAMA
ncbi:hypothetical protein AMTRI_Chr05g59820 [Amborella trichopoda]